MSIVSLLNVSVLNNPAKFTDQYEFEITFECLEPLKDDLEWKLTYVGSSTSFEHDQELDSLLVGPVPVGVNKFVFSADPPSPDLIPASELVSVTVILLSCSYAGNEFVRVGYYVNNEYDAPELNENPPSRVQVDHVVRNVLAEKPRVTRFNIPWDSDQPLHEYPPEQPDADLADDENYAEDEEEEEEEGEGEGDQEQEPEPEQDQEQEQDQADDDVEDIEEEDEDQDQMEVEAEEKPEKEQAQEQEPEQQEESQEQEEDLEETADIDEDAEAENTKESGQEEQKDGESA